MSASSSTTRIKAIDAELQGFQGAAKPRTIRRRGVHFSAEGPYLSGEGRSLLYYGRDMAKPQKGAPVPIVVMGLGFIGQEVARAALSSEEVELIGAVDVSPHLAGKKLSDVLKIPAGTF